MISVVTISRGQGIYSTWKQNAAPLLVAPWPFPFHSPITVHGLAAGTSDGGGIGQGGDQSDAEKRENSGCLHPRSSRGVVANCSNDRSTVYSRYERGEKRASLSSFLPSFFPLSIHPLAGARGRIARRSTDRLIRAWSATLTNEQQSCNERSRSAFR